MGAIFFILVFIGIMLLMCGNRGLHFGCCGVNHSNHSNHSNDGSNYKDPISIAKERYARGEITQEEFRNIQEQFKK